MSRACVVFCVEPGWLEPQARLLVRSIRRYGGRDRNCEIWAVQPRDLAPLSSETATLFRELGVRHIAEPLNSLHAAIPTVNKVYAVARVEQETASEFVVFLDTDTVVVKEPALFRLPQAADIAVQPTFKKFAGSSGPNDPADRFWMSLYKACEVATPPYVMTLADRRIIRGYYNGGLIVFRRSAGLGARWREHLSVIEGLVENRRHNLDQFALATVAASRPGRVVLLPQNYNYNVARRSELVGRRRHLRFDELVHIHYHEAFAAEEFLRRVRPSFDARDERLIWLQGQLPLPSAGGNAWRPRRNILRRLRTMITILRNRTLSIEPDLAMAE